MKNQHKQICYNCNGKEFELIHEGVRDNQNLDVLRCKDCSLVCLSDMSHISDSFYENSGMTNGTDLKRWQENTAGDDKRRFDFLKSRIENKTLIDFGCGNAGFLNLAKQVCKKVFGTELQKEFYEYFEECGLEVYPNISEMPEKADIITMFHVLEHLTDPIETLKNLKTILEDEGKIIIEVPNSNDALLSLYKNNDFANFTYWSCHLYLYNEKTLRQIVEKSGYKVDSVHHIQRYNLLNHLYWQFNKKPGGHEKWKRFANGFDFELLNYIYEIFLKSLKKTDTLIFEISKK